MISCSIGICVYNEEKNIEKLLNSILAQKLHKSRITEILIIASGSTDNTVNIVKKYSRKNKKIKLFTQKKREGKASAVNIFIENAKSNILVLSSGDLILTNQVIEMLIREFQIADVGMTGAHPVPINPIDDGLFGFGAHLLWELHHRISLKKPKMGEFIAFRKIFKRIPLISVTDEANIEPLIRGQGYVIKYLPKAIIYNKAPTTITDFIKQRRRTYNGHLVAKYEQSYEVSTLSPFLIFRLLIAYLIENPRPKYIVYSSIIMTLEGYSRFLGWWDYIVRKKYHTVWDFVETTKDLNYSK